MKHYKLFASFLLLLCMACNGVFAQILSSSEIPSDEERQAESARLEKKREEMEDRKSTRLNSSHSQQSRMPSSA